MPVQKNVNRDFFKVWSSDMAYVLGFFAADGNMISNKRGAHYFSIEICDREMVEKIKCLLQSDHKIGIRAPKHNDRAQYRLQIGSKEMYMDLESLGFSDKKSHRVSMPHVPPEFLNSFIRGYFDGDGNVWMGNMHRDRKKASYALLTTFTSSSRKMLEDMKAALEAFGLKGGSFITYDTFYRLSYATENSLKLYDVMYNSEHCGLYLDRKKRTFERFMELRA